MKKALRITKCVALALLLTVYVVVALLNYSVVQSYLGAAAGRYFSNEWGGEVKIGSLHVSPFAHLRLHHVLLVSPDNDTLLDAERLECKFHHFPVSGEGLDVDYLLLKNATYHFARKEHGNNLSYIIDYYGKGGGAKGRFVVRVKEFRMSNVRYRQDLRDKPRYADIPGVRIPHMDFKGTDALFRNIYVEGDSITCRMVHFTTTERSGLHLVDLSGDVEVSRHVIRMTNMDLETDDSRLLCDAEMQYHSWKSMKSHKYCDSVYHRLVLRDGTSVNMQDVAYWVPQMWGMNEEIELTGTFYGPVSDMHVENMVATINDSTLIDMDGYIEGLPHVSNVNANIHRLRTSGPALLAFAHPEGTQMPMPHLLKQLKQLDLQATLAGSPKDCMSTVMLYSNLGHVEAMASVRYDDVCRDYAYKAEVGSSGVDVSTLLPNDWVTRSGLDLTVQGRGTSFKTMVASLEGELYNTMLQGNNIDVTNLTAQLDHGVVTADVQLQDTLLHLDLTGRADLSDSTNRYNADLQLRAADMTALHLWNEKDSNVALSTQLHAEVQGNDLEHLTGKIALSNTSLQIDDRHATLQEANLDVDQRHNMKRVNLNSDWLTLGMRGYFTYQSLPIIYRHFCKNYLPVYYQPRNTSPMDEAAIADAHITLDVQLHDARRDLEQLFEGVELAYGTTLNCNYNYTESMKAVLRTDSIRVGGVCMRGIGMSSGQQGDSYRVTLDADAVTVGGGMPLFDHVDIAIGSNSRQAVCRLKWDDDAATHYNEGDIAVEMQSDTLGNRLTVTHPSFYMAGNQWNIVCPQDILFASKYLNVEDLRVVGDDQSIKLHTLMHDNPEDSVEVLFNNFQLDRLAQLLIHDESWEVRGTLDGQCTLFGLGSQPYLKADLDAEGCVLNGQMLGDIDINTNWNAELNHLNLVLGSTLPSEKGSLTPLAANGYVDLSVDDPELNLIVELNQLPMAILQPLTKNFSSNMEGGLSGQLDVDGTLRNPQLEGEAWIENGRVKVDALNVTYRIDDTLSLTDGQLTLDDWIVRDERGGKATVNGVLDISDLSDMKVNVSLHTDRLLLLNQSQQDATSYYGTLFAAADGTLRGPVSNLTAAVTATTLTGSEISVPISDRRQVAEQNYITFVSDEVYVQPSYQTRRNENKEKTQSGGLQLLAEVRLTPDLRLHLPMDFSQMTADLNASGAGELQFSLTDGGNPNLLGSYEISNGTLAMDLVNLIQRNFTIEEGSSLNFPGSISDASFDIRALYTQRVNLSSLTGMSAATETSQKTIPVSNVIALTGTLDAPRLGFDIRLPNADQSVEEEVFAYIDRTNEQEMLNQTVSLLVMGQFASSAANAEGNTDILETGLSGGYSMVANTVGNMVSKMVQVVDINFDYTAATDLTTEQYEVDISKEWNKLYFESTFGYGGEMRDVSTMDGNTTLVGDMLLGYKLSPRVHLFVFNRTNTNDYTRVDLPYKQGVGLKFTRDFNHLSDLFRKRNSETR